MSLRLRKERREESDLNGSNGRRQGYGGYLLLGLEIVKEDGAFLAFFAPVADDDAGAVDDFSGVAFAVEDA